MIAQAGRVEIEALAGDHERADGLAVLLEVAFGELLAGPLRAGAHPPVAVAAAQFAAVAG